MAAGRELFKLFGLIGMHGVEKTTKQIKGIDKQVRKTQKEFDRLGRRAQLVGKVLTKAFTLPLLIIGAAVIKMTADFDEAMTTSLAIMGDLSDTMRKDLSNAAIEVSKVMKFSATQAAEAYFFLASAGKSAAQSIGLLPLVARFAQAGNFDLARATDLLTDAQSALGLSSKDTAKDMTNMARVSDVLVKANTLANASVAQFSESLTNKAGAALRILNKGLEEGVAVLAVFADQGLKGAAAGESLNIVMRDLQRAALKNKEAFKEGEVAVFDQTGKMRNMADIIRDLDGLLKGMSDAQRRATLTTLGFQDKSISATMALLGTADAIEEYEKKLRSAAGITEEVAEKQLKTFWKQLGLIKNRLIAVGLQGKGFAEIGNEVLLPIFDKMVRALEKLSNWWNGLDDSMRRTAKGFIVLAAAVGPTVFIIGKLIVWSKLLIPLFVALKAGTLSWAGAMAALQGSMLAITLLITALVALGWFWFSQWDTLSVQIEALWAKMSLAINKAAFGMLQSIADAAITAIQWITKVAGMLPGVEKANNRVIKDILMFKAALFKDLGRQQIYANTINESAEATTTLTESLKKAVKAAKEAIGIKEEDTEASKKNLDAQLKSARAAEDTAKKIAQFNADILDQTRKLGADKIELLAIEREKAVLEAETLGADVFAVKKLFAGKEKELQAEAKQERDDFDASSKSKLEAMLGNQLELLELEKQETLLKAEELGAQKFEILALFALKEQALRDKIRKEDAAKDRQILKDRLNQSSKIGNKLNSILGKFSDNRLKRLDNEEKRNIAAIENSQMTEEQKETAIQTIQEETEKKRRSMERERAKREKLAALFNIAINTASAIVEALPNIPLSFVVGALGIAEGVAVATTPLPFFEGAMIEGSQGGVNAIVGEDNQDEIVFPLEKGIGLFIDGLLDRIADISIPSFGQPELAGAAAGPASNIHLHIGTFIGDDRSFKELERRLATVRIAENQRKGI